MKILLKLKTWQLFIILCTPFIISSSITLMFPTLHGIFGTLWVVFYLSWLYAIGSILYHNLKKGKHRTWFLLFQVCTIISMVSHLLTPVVAPLNIPGTFKLVIYISSALGFLFSIGYSARIFTLSDHNRSTFFSNLVTLWLFPIGLWIIHPKLKALIAPVKPV